MWKAALIGRQFCWNTNEWHCVRNEQDEDECKNCQYASVYVVQIFKVIIIISTRWFMELFCAYSLITTHLASLVNVLRCFFFVSLPFCCVSTLHMCKRIYRNSCYAREQFGWCFFSSSFQLNWRLFNRLWLHLRSVQMNYQLKHMIKLIEMKKIIWVSNQWTWENDRHKDWWLTHWFDQQPLHFIKSFPIRRRTSNKITDLDRIVMA